MCKFSEILIEKNFRNFRRIAKNGEAKRIRFASLRRKTFGIRFRFASLFDSKKKKFAFAIDFWPKFEALAQGPKCAEEALRPAHSYTVSAGECCHAINISAEAGADFKYPEALGRYSLVSDPYPLAFPDSHKFTLSTARKFNDRVLYEKDSNSCKDKKYYIYYTAYVSKTKIAGYLKLLLAQPDTG